MGIQRAIPHAIVVDVRDFGARLNGKSDDTAAVAEAGEAVGAAGGGVVFSPPGTLLCNDVTTGNGWAFVIPVKRDNVTFRGCGAATTIKTAMAIPDNSRVMFMVNGAGKPAGMASWGSYEAYQAADTTTYTLAAGTYAKGATSVTLNTVAEAANFAAGDDIYIRTGNLIAVGITEPDAEFNVVESADSGTGVIILKYPLAKTYAQEYFISGTTGKTSTTPTANAAVFGVAKVTDRVVRNVRFENFNIDSTGQAIWLRQAIGVHIENVNGVGSKALQGGGSYRGLTVRDCTYHVRDSDWEGNWYCSMATGCSDILYENLHLSSVSVNTLHIHEGVARWTVRDCRLLGKDNASTALVPLSINARSYDGLVDGLLIVGAGNGNPIIVDADCDDGGVIRNTTVISSTATSISIQGDNWVYDPFNRSSITVNTRGSNDRSNVERIQGWVADDSQNPTIGRIPVNSLILRAWLFVSEAFNSDGTDQISCGWDASTTAIFTATDVSTAGLKTPTVTSTYQATARDVEAYYTNGGSEPTTGKAFVVVEYVRVGAVPT